LPSPTTRTFLPFRSIMARILPATSIIVHRAQRRGRRN
jgi:hypothetical protein